MTAVTVKDEEDGFNRASNESQGDGSSSRTKKDIAALCSLLLLLTGALHGTIDDGQNRRRLLFRFALSQPSTSSICVQRNMENTQRKSTEPTEQDAGLRRWERQQHADRRSATMQGSGRVQALVGSRSLAAPDALAASDLLPTQPCVRCHRPRHRKHPRGRASELFVTATAIATALLIAPSAYVSYRLPSSVSDGVLARGLL